MRKVMAIAMLVSVPGCGDPDFNVKYPKITNGMTKDEVVKLMGSPGTEIGTGWVPSGQNGPVVTGSRFLEWKKDSPTHRIIVGFDNDKVVSKWEWIPNL